MSVQILARPLTTEAFAPFGDMLEIGVQPLDESSDIRSDEAPPLATFASGAAGEPLSIRLVEPAPVVPPFQLFSLERHPSARRTVIPMSRRLHTFVVAEDRGGVPGTPVAFYTTGAFGVQYRRGVWHRFHAPIGRTQPFCLIESASAPLERITLDRPQLIGLGLGFPRRVECATT